MNVSPAPTVLRTVLARKGTDLGLWHRPSCMTSKKDFDTTQVRKAVMPERQRVGRFHSTHPARQSGGMVGSQMLPSYAPNRRDWTGARADSKEDWTLTQPLGSRPRTDSQGNA